MKWEYNECQVTISTIRTVDNEWKYDVVIEPNLHVGTNVGTFPEPTFETEEEAICAAKKVAEWRIDHPIVKPNTGSRG